MKLLRLPGEVRRESRKGIIALFLVAGGDYEVEI